MCGLLGVCVLSSTAPSDASPSPLLDNSPLPAHGQYSSAYMSDWSSLPTGDSLARHDPTSFSLQSVVGEQVRQVWRNLDEVHLTNLQYEVNWGSSTASKTDTTLFLFENVKNVVIENLVIVQNNPDYRAYDTIRIEGADNVTIRNVYFAGPTESYHLRLEGVKDIMVDRIEVAGIDFDGDGRSRVGGGLWINNGATGGGGHNNTGVFTPHARVPGWQVVQNSYFHGATESDGKSRNQDAVLIHSVSHGLLFNTVVEDWVRPMGESAIDLSFRRQEAPFQNRFFRVERNVLSNATFYKSVGGVGRSNTIFWANNLFVNAQMADYHGGNTNDVHFTHNTYIFDKSKIPPELIGMEDRGATGYAALWNIRGDTFLNNSLVYVAEGNFNVLYLNNEGEPDKYKYFHADHNVYAFGAVPPVWVRNASGQLFRTAGQWSDATGNDLFSVIVPTSEVVFVAYEDGDFRLLENPWPDVTTLEFLFPENPWMTVDRDFHGRLRTHEASLAPGAFVVFVPDPATGWLLTVAGILLVRRRGSLRQSPAIQELVHHEPTCESLRVVRV